MRNSGAEDSKSLEISVIDDVRVHGAAAALATPSLMNLEVICFTSSDDAIPPSLQRNFYGAESQLCGSSAGESQVRETQQPISCVIGCVAEAKDDCVAPQISSALGTGWENELQTPGRRLALQTAKCRPCPWILLASNVRSRAL